MDRSLAIGTQRQGLEKVRDAGLRGREFAFRPVKAFVQFTEFGSEVVRLSRMDVIRIPHVRTAAAPDLDEPLGLQQAKRDADRVPGNGVLRDELSVGGQLGARGIRGLLADLRSERVRQAPALQAFVVHDDKPTHLSCASCLTWPLNLVTVLSQSSGASQLIAGPGAAAKHVTGPLPPTDQKETTAIMPQPLTRDLALDFVLETVLGTPAELWLGEPGEGSEERSARLDAAADILADDPDAPGAGFLRDLLFEDVIRPGGVSAGERDADDGELAEAA